MKTRMLLSCFLLAVLLALSLAPAASAEVFFSGEEETLGGEIDATAFLAGSDPVSTANVKGILFEAGKTVNVGGACEYAFVAGNAVNVTGQVLREAFIGGNSVTFTGSCGRDLLAAGNALDIRGSIERDLAATGKSVVLGGRVGGGVTLAAEQITVTDDAEIGGTLRCNASAKISAPADILARIETYADDTSDSAGEQTAAPVSSASPLRAVKSRVFRYIGLLLIAFFLLWLTPLWEKLDADYTGRDFGAYAGAFGIGFAVLAALPIAAIILMVTGLGLRPAFVLLSVYTAAIIASPVFLGFFLGSLLWRKALKKARNYWAELAVGLALWSVLALIPYISFLFRLVSVALGLGVLTRLLGKKRGKAPASPVLPEQAL